MACLGKKLVFHTEICVFLEKRILKIGLFHRVKEFFKVNQIDIPDYQYYLGCDAEKYGPPNFPRKKVRISIGIFDFFAYYILKKLLNFIGS